MPPREPDQIPLQVPLPKQTITPPGTVGGFTPNPGHPDHIPALRTYSTDLAEAMRKNDGSVVRIALAEDERRRQQSQAVDPTSKKNLTFIIASIVIIILATAGVGGIYWYTHKDTRTVVPETPVLPASMVRSDEAVSIDITGKPVAEIAQKIREMVNTRNTRPGTVKNIVPITQNADSKTPIVATNFLAALVTHAPPSFVRSLKNNFMLGSYDYDAPNLFIVLSGTAHDYMYTGMLAWEPKLLGDLGPLFAIDTTNAYRSYLDTVFTDGIIENRDVRILYTLDKKPILFYTFLDPNTVVITADPKTLVETIRRFGN